MRCMYWLISCCCFVNISTLASLADSSPPSAASFPSESGSAAGREESLTICSGLRALGVEISRVEVPRPKPLVRFCRLKLKTS